MGTLELRADRRSLSYVNDAETRFEARSAAGALARRHSGNRSVSSRIPPGLIHVTAGRAKAKATQPAINAGQFALRLRPVDPKE
jgi:hypothetical protein